MKYLMNSGVLSLESSSTLLAKIKSSLVGPTKKIYLPGNLPVLNISIHNLDAPERPRGDVRNRLYIMTDRELNRIAEAHPDYAPGEDPDITGWPVCRLPQVDNGRVIVQGTPFLLTMHNSQNYSLRSESGQNVLRMMHRGICGGWIFEDDHGFEPELLCGLFVFGRYLEQENEFLIV